MSSKFSTELPSDTCTRTVIINFSATLEGYQDQLLSATINIVCVGSLSGVGVGGGGGGGGGFLRKLIRGRG